MQQQLTAGAFRLFTALGVRVHVHWTWFLLPLLYWQWGRLGEQPLTGLLELVGLFAIVLLHEYGHSLATRSVGGRADTIVLWPLGGVAFVQPPSRPGAQLWAVAAGPLVNVVLAPLLLGALWVIDPSLSLAQNLGSEDALLRFLTVMFTYNTLLCLFNLLPVYPLDGGQILQSVLWFFMRRSRSLKIAAVVGMAAAGVGLALALSKGDMWLVVLAAFVGWRAYEGFNISRAMMRVEDQYGSDIWRQV